MASKNLTDQVRDLRDTVLTNDVRQSAIERRMDAHDARAADALGREADYAVLAAQIAVLEKEAAENANLRERLAVAESHIADLRRTGEEAGRWNRTLLGIGVGAVLSLLGGVVVQLVAVGLRTRP